MKLFAKKTTTTTDKVNAQPDALTELTPLEVDSVSGGRMLYCETDTGSSCDWREVWVY